MRIEVQLYIQGKVVREIVEARDYEDAKNVALKRNSEHARVISATAVFR